MILNKMEINKFENKGKKFVSFLKGYENRFKVLESETVLIFQVSLYLHTFSKLKESNGYKYGIVALNIGDRPFDSNFYEFYSEKEFQEIVKYKDSL